MLADRLSVLLRNTGRHLVIGLSLVGGLAVTDPEVWRWLNEANTRRAVRRPRVPAPPSYGGNDDEYGYAASERVG